MRAINDKTDKERLLLINKIYELGYEVGYKNHSEIGWVLREYTRLTKEALSIGIQSPESYYNDGKIKGKASRDKGISEPSGEKKDHVSSTEIDIDNPPEEIDESDFLKKPPMCNFPRMVEKISMVEIPKILYGFRLFRKK